MASKSVMPAGYAALLARVKERVRTAQIKAALSANRELLLLYWDIGRAIVEAQKDKGHGKRVVEMRSVDLRREFSTMTGLSALNLWRMRAFYLAYASNQKLSQPVTESDSRRHRIVKQPVSEIVPKPMRDSSPSILSQPVTESADAIELLASLPWGHNIVLMGGDIKSRIANAKKDPTYLFADVELVGSFKLSNVNRKRLETLLHKFFSSARLDLALNLGGGIEPREWFLLPLPVIEDAIEKLKDGTIANYRYNPKTARIEERDPVELVHAERQRAS